MSIRIALAGNPNCGKTTLFNALTGSNQFVGNWPGVTVEKKEGRLKDKDDVIVTDLPGIYSLSPYTLEEVVARNYLIYERPEAILNIVDGTNLERNLYLTTQLAEIGLPLVIAINMMDVVEKNGDRIDIERLSKELGCKVMDISALKGTGITEAVEAAIRAADKNKPVPHHVFSGPVEHALAHIEEACVHDLPDEQQRWYAIKLFERDAKVMEKLGISEETAAHIEKDIAGAERELDDDAESIITNERYNYITSITEKCVEKKNKGMLTTSDKIDRIVTSRFLGLPIFAAIMFTVYFTAMVAVGTPMTDFVNNSVFGDGFHLFGIGSEQYEQKSVEYRDALRAANAYCKFDLGADGFDPDEALSRMSETSGSDFTAISVQDEETLGTSEMKVYFTEVPADAGEDVVPISYLDSVGYFRENGFDAPDPAAYGTWVPSIPAIIEGLLDRANVADWLKSLILDGIVSGVGSVIGFAPQMFVLFLMLAFLEACGYMSRIAFVLDRVFSRFGLSGKSFIPLLIASGCGVPGIMSSRTIENVNERRMTLITTTFIPCGAKMPVIAMIAGAVFGGSAWVATSAYFVGVAAVIISGVILKKTSAFAGESAPFVMELPAYHMPTAKNVLRSMWERGWSFVKKAVSVILVSSVIIWFTTYFGFTDEGFRMLSVDELDMSLLAAFGSVFAWIFKPLGWGTWQAAVATLTGLVAKENIVGTLGVLYGGRDTTVWQTLAASFTTVTGYSFLMFNLLCAPCIAAISAIKQEMNSAKWTFFAVAWQCGFAYCTAFLITQFGNLFTGNGSVPGTIAAGAITAVALYFLFVKKLQVSQEQK